ncbi:MAG: McrB family protein, partial [Culicoidibacterales bacterium]
MGYILKYDYETIGTYNSMGDVVYYLVKHMVENLENSTLEILKKKLEILNGKTEIILSKTDILNQKTNVRKEDYWTKKRDWLVTNNGEEFGVYSEWRNVKGGNFPNFVEKIKEEKYFVSEYNEKNTKISEEVILLEYQTSKNTILYGPPGTGKTYATAKHAVSICDQVDINTLMDYDDVMDRYRKLMAENRIAFVTFHQSYGYEEFIEGIKPVVETDDDQNEITYEIAEGVFKAFCDQSRVEEVKFFSSNAGVWKVTIMDSVIKDCYANNRIRIGFNQNQLDAKGFVEKMEIGDIVLTTNKSRTNINGIAIVTGEIEELKEADNNTSRQVEWIANELDVEIPTYNNGKLMHRKTVARLPQMKAVDVIKILRDLDLQNVRVESDNIQAGEVSPTQKPYVFIIDEINRGNMSKIFGELITLIEETKREGMLECVPAILPYSGKKFTVPANIHILGTMNTADRSIALIDTALRRRFDFIEMLPDYTVLQGINIDGIDIAKMLEVMNNRITYLYDREHTIGHAFFMSLKNNQTIEQLARIFSKKVIPLLQEYFYEDYEKIRLILGDNAKAINEQFIQATSIELNKLFVGEVSDDLDDEKTYVINDAA